MTKKTLFLTLLILLVVAGAGFGIYFVLKPDEKVLQEGISETTSDSTQSVFGDILKEPTVENELDMQEGSKTTDETDSSTNSNSNLEVVEEIVATKYNGFPEEHVSSINVVSQDNKDVTAGNTGFFIYGSDQQLFVVGTLVSWNNQVAVMDPQNGLNSIQLRVPDTGVYKHLEGEVYIVSNEEVEALVGETLSVWLGSISGELAFMEFAVIDPSYDGH